MRAGSILIYPIIKIRQSEIQNLKSNVMYHPTTRLLTILELLQAHGELSGVDLAARLEVDVRTVRRYITMLQDMAIPIESERGRHGCYRLRPGYKLPPLMISTEEAQAITLGLLMTRRLGLGVDAVSVEGALAKIERVLPPELKQTIHALTEVLVVETPLPDKGPNSQVVNTLSLAVQRQEQVWLRYRALKNDETERAVDPYGVLYRNGYWYMAGYCHLRQGLRAFRLDRVVDVAQRPIPFARPADFDVLAFIEESIAQTPGVWTVDLLLHTTLAEAERMIPRAVGKPRQVEGGVALRAYVQNLDRFAYFLAQVDCPVQVLQPPEARRCLYNSLRTRLDQWRLVKILPVILPSLYSTFHHFCLAIGTIAASDRIEKSREGRRGSTMSSDVKSMSDEEVIARIVQLGFGGDQARFDAFYNKLRMDLPPGTGVALRGSVVTSERWQDGAPFDSEGVGTSDLDVTLIGNAVMECWEQEAFYIPKLHTNLIR